jgi:hypothetical protein
VLVDTTNPNTRNLVFGYKFPATIFVSTIDSLMDSIV